MKASRRLIEAIKRFEACRLTAYQDSVSVWTIGYGHTKGVKRGDRISVQQAEKMLMDDLAVYEEAARKVRGIRTQGQFDAVVDFMYNCGVANFEKSTLKRYIESGRKTAEIQREFLKWINAGGKPLDGLFSRRVWEAARWNE